MRQLLFVAALSLAPLIADGTMMLEDVNWVALEVMGKAVTKNAGRPVYIQLHSLDKKLTGFSGCNNVFGAYEFSHESLKFDPVAATRMACLDANVEPQFLEALAGTATFRIADDKLQLMNKNGEVIGRFRASGPAPPAATKTKQ
jgi:heat shock protein HslJ